MAGGAHVSLAERRSVAAERDAVDRYCALYLAERLGAVFTGRINGVTRFGLFVTLDDSGADGLVPISALGDDRYVHDERRRRLVGRRHGRTWRLGQTVEVRLVEADPVSASLILHVVDGGGRR